MSEKLIFRDLTPEEIEVRIGSCSQYGVMLLLYKNARVDMDILDEVVGPEGWKREHTRDNKNCVVSIWDSDKNEWVSKEDTGVESYTEKEKGLASDSFKRACVNWGIGRKLYTRLNIFIFADKLKGLKQSKDKWICDDQFVVSDIQYNDTKITSCTITVLDKKNTPYYSQRFTPAVIAKAQTSQPTQQRTVAAQPAKAAPVQPTKPTQAIQSNQTNQPNQTTAKPQQMQPMQPVQKAHPTIMQDDEVLLIGNFRGAKFGDVKNNPRFKELLNWTKTQSATRYTDEAVRLQFSKLKALAESEAV